MASTGQPSGKSVLKGVAMIGLEWAKTSVHFVGLDASGRLLKRPPVLEWQARGDHCQGGSVPHRNGACCSAHHLGRQLLA